ncbi:MAG: hypothetical protein PHZ26_01355 [Candidatus Gracilibacteria bacterium]|nr:hypothetical protein [Candidatus Gracilibacteria bacterium]MDD2908382.1 hypothetical protein [Candidatus Gracilibacteria bacterium]
MSNIDKGPNIDTSNENVDSIKSPGGNHYLKSLQRGFIKTYDNVKTYLNSDEYEKKIGEELQKPLDPKKIDDYNKNNPFYKPKK